MNSLPPSPPRFVPTLTEIVRPDELAQQTFGTLPVVEESAPVMSLQGQPRKEPEVRLDLDALVRRLVAEQVDIMRRGLLEDVQSLVQQAVAQALTDPKSEPELK